jgi:hypothetical protein
MAQLENKSCLAPGNKKHATTLALIIWLISFALSFVIAPKSNLIFLPDLLLLLGFIPLLFMVPYTWPWLVFGALNIVIGFTLQVACFLSPEALPKSMSPLLAHLANYHSPMIWIWMGLVCLFYAAIKLIKVSIRLCQNGLKKKNCAKTVRKQNE